MKTTIGGDRLGSGSKQQVSMRNYERSTHDLSYIWRSSMASGTLVPFMSEVALPGDSWDMELNCEVLTLPTVGPLFGKYKVQLDVFQVPMRLYNAGLHMNKLGIGMDMSSVYLPTVDVEVNNLRTHTYADGEQVNTSALMRYLGVSGIGNVDAEAQQTVVRRFNAVPLLGYWDIYKNYYANKQEERGYRIHIDDDNESQVNTIRSAYVYTKQARGSRRLIGNSLSNAVTVDISDDRITTDIEMDIFFQPQANRPNVNEVKTTVDDVDEFITDLFDQITWDDITKRYVCRSWSRPPAIYVFNTAPEYVEPEDGPQEFTLIAEEFPLENIDKMREQILQHPFDNGVFRINSLSLAPYSDHLQGVGAAQEKKFSIEYSQESLGIKTYQSDLFNNWISTEWIDGDNGINAITSVDTSDGNFTIDALNLASKVYIMLNRIAISGGSYDDWLDAVYTHERQKSLESPVYHGSLIKELGFQEVVSNSETVTEDDPDGDMTDQRKRPLGTLAGKGKLTGKHKGGKIKIKVDEPSYIMGIVSITPILDYSQGNKWDMNLQTMNDLHKPQLGAIGYQDLITEQMHYADTLHGPSQPGTTVFKSAGKQPAWINYMTNYNKTYGNFAEAGKEMFMTLNRRYEIGPDGIMDLTTYIDPTKFNNIFAQRDITSQNFWVQIANNITARRKMSAKVIPNL